MRTRRREQNQATRRVRRDRRRLGRFVVFAEMEADLRPISLFERRAPSSRLNQIRALLRHRG